MTDPVDRLARAFAVLLAAAREDPAVAQALTDALDGEAPGATNEAGERAPAGARADASPGAGGRVEAAASPAVLAIDPVALMRAGRGDALRADLARLTRSEILALIKARDLDARGVSTFNKAHLIEHVASSARRRAGRRRSPLDY